MSTSTLRVSTTLALALGLAACGGGGGSSSDPNTPPPPSTSLAITSGNAVSAAEATWASANSSLGITDLVGNTGLVASAPGGISKTDGSFFKTGSLIGVLHQIPVGPDVFPCQVSGTVTVSGDLANPLTLTANDTLNVDSDACDDGLGEVVDGLLAFTVEEFEGDLFAGAYLLTMGMRLTDFQITTSADVLTSFGDARVTLDTRAAPAVSASVSGASLTTDSDTKSTTLTGFASAQAVDAGLQPAPYTLDSSGMLDDTELSGAVSYSTPVIFQGFDVDYPSSGELLIQGDSSSARLIAIDNVNVRIEIDNNGDNTVDDTIDTSWAALAN